MTDSRQPDSKEMIEYLLGEMPDEQKIIFEQACLEDDQLFEELLAVEAELTDDYARGALAGSKREAFEHRLLNSPGSTEQLQLSRLLTQKSVNTVSDDKSARVSTHFRDWFDFSQFFVQRPALGWIAAVALLALAVGLGLLWRNASGPERTAQIPNPPRQETGPSPEQKVSPSPPQAMVATFVLTAGSERDAGAANDIRVRPGTERIRLVVPLESLHEATNYSAVARRVEGETVLTLPNIQATRSSTGYQLAMEFPAQSLPLGDYILTVSEVIGGNPEVVGRYFLRRLR